MSASAIVLTKGPLGTIKIKSINGFEASDDNMYIDEYLTAAQIYGSIFFNRHIIQAPTGTETLEGFITGMPSSALLLTKEHVRNFLGWYDYFKKNYSELQKITVLTDGIAYTPSKGPFYTTDDRSKQVMPFMMYSNSPDYLPRLSHPFIGITIHISLE